MMLSKVAKAALLVIQGGRDPDAFLASLVVGRELSRRPLGHMFIYIPRRSSSFPFPSTCVIRCPCLCECRIRSRLNRAGTIRAGWPQVSVTVRYVPRLPVVDLDRFCKTIFPYQVRGMVRSQYMGVGHDHTAGVVGEEKSQKAGRNSRKGRQSGQHPTGTARTEPWNPMQAGPHERVSSWSHEAARPSGPRGVGPPRPVSRVL